MDKLDNFVISLICQYLDDVDLLKLIKVFPKSISEYVIQRDKITETNIVEAYLKLKINLNKKLKDLSKKLIDTQDELELYSEYRDAAPYTEDWDICAICCAPVYYKEMYTCAYDSHGFSDENSCCKYCFQKGYSDYVDLKRIDKQKFDDLGLSDDGVLFDELKVYIDNMIEKDNNLVFCDTGECVVNFLRNSGLIKNQIHS